MYKLIVTILLLPLALHADIDKIRIVWQEGPESEAKIIWNQVSGSTPTVHYGKLDHGQSANNYENSKSPDSSLNYKGMNNQYATLSGLQADTNYYFVIQDSTGVSQRYYFHTAPATKKAFKFIQGGDSRNNRDVRQEGNRLVAKIRPLFVSFGGDMTSSGTDEQWQAWLDDWQLSIASDGRIFPIVPIRGNHESSSYIPNIFGVNNSDSYYKITVADKLFCQYLLNSEINTSGAQKDWLKADLEANKGLVTFLSASYHKPMRPHVSSKSEGDDVYDAWAQLFYDYRFDLLAENDSHCVKRTVRVKPSTGSGSDEGFIADDSGFVMIGEGTWGAPKRDANDNKEWTLDSGKFNSFDLVHVSLDKIEVRTIDFDGEANVSALSELDNVFEIPSGLNIWQANGGAVQILAARDRTNTPGTSETIAFPFASEWAYYDSIDAPSTDWMLSSYDDSAWFTGVGQLGYGDNDEATVLDYGGVSSNKTPTYYFRKQLSLSSVNDASSLSMNIVYDDGAVIYVNGQEVQRINMPDGEITHTSFASSTVNNNATSSIVIPSSYLLVGNNTIAVEIHNRGLSSSDISFDAEVISNQNNIGEPSTGIEQSVFEYNTTWAYYDSANAPAADWNSHGFDDSAWETGVGELGFGDNDEATVLDYGGVSSNKTVTYYFRKEFSLSSIDSESLLNLNLVYDDGAVIYINGQEVDRVNMPSGAVTHNTFSSSTIGNNATTSKEIPAAYLQVGVNTIAIEVHNRSLASSDISFNAQLTSNQNNVGEPSLPTEVNIFDFGSSWVYYDQVDAPENNWMNSSFDDTQWLYAHGEFGFGDGDEATLLDYGDSSSNKTVSYYFRKQFSLSSVDAQTLLSMNMIYDDGAIIYVNGQEVQRVNMPGGTISHSTFSSSTVGNNASTTVMIPSSFLVQGTNTIAVEMHNRSLGSSDISFNAQLISNQDNVQDLEVQLFQHGASWSYYDSIIAPLSTWFQEGFDDSQWQVANGQLGFGDGDETTVLDFGGNSSDKTTTYYFRKEITLRGLEEIDSMTFELTYDDGAVIYINGQEIKRINMPTGVVLHTTFASSTIGNNAKSSFSVPLSYLKEGINTVSIEIHNRSLTSSDISFDAALKITK